MTKLGRELPDLPAEVYFDQDECQVLIAYEAKHRKRPAHAPEHAPAPTLRKALRRGRQAGRVHRA